MQSDRLVLSIHHQINQHTICQHSLNSRVYNYYMMVQMALRVITVVVGEEHARQLDQNWEIYQH
ncbi:MAG: hypothetical protein ACKPKO_35895 [Candidatus Fonsibacter sp.]